MTTTLVDTNVLLDVFTSDPVWADWSLEALDAAAMVGPLFVNDVVYAELSIRFNSMESLETLLSEARIGHTAMPRAALFLVGKAFINYRRSGGTRTGVLPDFFIGAHAAVAMSRLTTRDEGRYRTYFPTVDVITPRSKDNETLDVSNR